MCLCPSVCTGVLFPAGIDISCSRYAEQTCTKQDRCSERQAAAKDQVYDCSPASSEAGACCSCHSKPSLMHPAFQWDLVAQPSASKVLSSKCFGENEDKTLFTNTVILMGCFGQS